MDAMPGAGKGDLSCAILRYLSSVGVHVRPGKLNPSQGEAVSVLTRRLFGVPLRSLPLSAHAEGVPKFIVNACELLRLHLHVEGLFRKTGSVTRIKALKARLEAGENCLHMALPCDVATLVKQFLRDLPEPLVPDELRGPLCRAQQRQEEDRGALSLLLTCLVPQTSASLLRYFFAFLQDVAARSSQNKMGVANLAVIFAPNLFPSEHCSKLDGEAEALLQTQAAVVELLITHASEIGIVPQSLLGKVQAAFSDTDHERQSPPGPEDGRGKEAESRRKRRRRRSVGNIVTEALSKFKSGRTLRVAPCPETKEGVSQGNESLNNSTSFNSKRKSSDDAMGMPELSVKKRRSALNSDSSTEEAFEQPVPADPVQGSSGQSSDEDFPLYRDQAAPDTPVECKNGTGASPDLDGVSCGHREPALGTMEGLLSNPPEAAPPRRQLRVLRRSLSWPEDLSTRDTAERGKPDSFPDEAAVIPGDRFGLAEPEQPGAEVTAAGMREAGIPSVCVTLVDRDRAARPQNEPRDVPNSLQASKPDLPDEQSARANGFRHLSKVPQSSLKRFTLHFQRMASQASKGPNVAKPKRKGGRHFGRSLSHESGLPLRAEEEAGCTAKEKGGTSLTPKSPLQSFKAYGQQIFIAHKHWAMAFAALRGRKDSAPPSSQEAERAAANSQDPLLGCRPGEERRRYCRSLKSPSVEPELVAGQDSVYL